ncbi:MAG: hypothetical protein JWN50_365 [Parcubacteria group bacterium]|nr:hypothetical protein [Parcubacteria group bacterium]
MNTYLNVGFFLLLAAELIYGSIRMYRKREYMMQGDPTSILSLTGTFLILLIGRAYFPSYFGHLTKWADGMTLIGFACMTMLGEWFQKLERKRGYPFLRSWVSDAWHSRVVLFILGGLTVALGAGLHYFHNQAMTFGSPKVFGLVFIEVALYAAGALIIVAAFLRHGTEKHSAGAST